MSVATAREMTPHEWALLPDDVEGELVDGRLVEEEMGSFVHDSVVAWIIALFSVWGRPRKVRVAASEVKYRTAARRGRKPDVTVILPGARRPPPQGLIESPPSIAVEVVSPSPADQRRDRVEKLHEYALFGVPFYWIVDPTLRTFDILELGVDGHYVHRVAATAGQIDSVPGCDGLLVDVDDLWREIDEIIAEGSKDDA